MVTSTPADAGTPDTASSAAQLTRKNKFITSFIAGAIAGATAKTLIAPLDRTKITFQASEDRFSVANAFKFLRNSVQRHGVLSLWRGNSATMARIIPYSAIQFASHEQYKHLLLVDCSAHQTILPKRFHSAVERFPVHIRRFLCGSLAGVTSVAFTYPLDFARARMAVAESSKYRTLYHVFRNVIAQEGALALYRGISPTMLGSIPYAGTSFFTYETLKKFVISRKDKEEDSESHLPPQPNPMERMLCGALAGLIGQTSSYPLDIVRRRMQTAGVTGHPEYTRGVWSTLMIVWRHEGLVHGLYKGLSMNWVKGPIAVGTSFTVFDFAQMELRKLPWFHDS